LTHELFSRLRPLFWLRAYLEMVKRLEGAPSTLTIPRERSRSEVEETGSGTVKVRKAGKLPAQVSVVAPVMEITY
jgi:hypothetical protein